MEVVRYREVFKIIRESQTVDEMNLSRESHVKDGKGESYQDGEYICSFFHIYINRSAELMNLTS